LIQKLRRIGLSKYEASIYISLLKSHVNTATELSKRSNVPRTKIYQILNSLQEKGWIKVYSGFPLLFKANPPEEVIERIKREQSELLDLLKNNLKGMHERMKKFVIMKLNIGLAKLKDEIEKSKTIWISNATTDFINSISDSLPDDTEVKVVMFPGEKKLGILNARFRESEIEIVKIFNGKEVASISVILDEERTFYVTMDPKSKRNVVDEMLFDECNQCMMSWYKLGFNNATEMN